ncbi:MAG: DUF2666 family protein [Candidatus Micrarchaeota archaeon]
MEEDEIIFTGGYKDFRLGVRFPVSGKKPGEVAAILAFISESIEPYAFRFSGIDTAGIEKLAAPGGRGIAGAAAFLESIPPNELRARIMQLAPKPELYPAAESYFLNRLLSKAGVPFKVAPSASKPEEEKVEDVIGFIGKYGQWVAIKKLGLEKVQDYEVSGILAGINNTIVNKAFEFAGMESQTGESTKRKTFGNLAQALRELEGKLSGGPEDACAVCKALEAVGYKPYASPEMLTEAYPDIKPPKVRGRKPKG